MPNYLINYQTVTDWQVVVEADSEEEAKELLINGEADEKEFVMDDLNYDSIDIMEVEDE